MTVRKDVDSLYGTVIFGVFMLFKDILSPREASGDV